MTLGTGAYRVSARTPSPWFLVTPPQPAGDAIDRPRVATLLDQLVMRHRVTLVTAPAGFGKTTAVAQWSRRSGEPVAWLSLTRFDEDPGRLLNGLVSALVRLADESGDERLGPLRAAGTDLADHGDTYRALVTAVEAVATPVVVVLDDVHLLGADAVRGALGLLVEHAPATLRLVLIGRHAPQLPLQRLRIADELGEIAADDLGFTTEEVVRVGRVSDTAAARIHTQTSGWPAAVRLALVDGHPDRAAVRRPDTASTRGLTRDSRLADYVIEEILDRLRPGLRRFVLDATTCQLLDRQLAVALTGADDSAALLEECRNRGLFLDRFSDAAREPVYRWHAIFADQCRTALLGRDPERADRLDRAAAVALASRSPLQAVVHARRGNDPALATRIIVDHWLELVLRSDTAALEQQCLALPPAWSESAIVLLIRACCRNLTDDRATAATLIARADGAARSPDRNTPSAADGPDGVAAVTSPEGYRVARGLAALLLADRNLELQEASDRVARLLREPVGWTPATHAAATFLLGWVELRLRRDPRGAVRLLQAGQRDCAATGQQVVAQRAAVNGAFALAYVGRFADARRKLAEVVPPDGGLDGWRSVEYAIEWLTDGFVAYWQDDLELALRRLRVQAVRPDVPGSPSALGRGYFGYAAVADGRPSALDEAEQLLREASRGERHGVPFHVYPHLGLAMVAIARGAPRRARGLLDAIPDYPHTHIVRVQMAEGYRQIGDADEALSRLARLEPVGQLPYVSATAWTTRALVEFGGGDPRSARACLARALDAAVPESIRRPFVGTDPLLRDLLTEHAARGTPHTAFVADCLARCALAVTRRAGVGEPLTRRELEVLGHLRTTMTVAEIAAAMGLSVNTVKTHLRTTYRKLGVDNRRDAIRVTG